MAEYISREEAINAIKSLESSMSAKDNYVKGYDAALGGALIAVREVPPASDVQSMNHGKWCGYLCSKCNEYADYFISGDFYFDEKPNFCPNCGADMSGDTK